MRRVRSYIFDLLFLGAPWSAYLGMFVTPERGNPIGGLGVAVAVMMYAAAGAVVMLVMQVMLFLTRGRTLGMSVTGLVAAKGRRWLALLLRPLLFLIALYVAFVIAHALGESSLISDDVATLLICLAPVGAAACDLVFLVGSQRRTLTDLVTGLHVVRDPALLALRASHQRGLNIVDVLVALGIGAPMVLAFGQVLGAVFGCLVGLLAFGALELALWRRTGATLGMRALAKQVSTEFARPGAE